MSKLTEKIKEEIVAVLPPTISFFVALHLVVFERALTCTLEQGSRSPRRYR
jgi:hypothetical protein